MTRSTVVTVLECAVQCSVLCGDPSLKALYSTPVARDRRLSYCVLSYQNTNTVLCTHMITFAVVLRTLRTAAATLPCHTATFTAIMIRDSSIRTDSQGWCYWAVRPS
jgi:hypothetical protein